MNILNFLENLLNLPFTKFIMSKFADAIVGIITLGIITFFIHKINPKGKLNANIIKFFRFYKVKDFILCILQKTFKLKRKTEKKPSLEEYINNFYKWTTKNETGITLSNVIIDSSPETFENIIKIEASLINPFTGLYTLNLEMAKPGYALFTQAILGIKKEEINKIAKRCYHETIIETHKTD